MTADETVYVVDDDAGVRKSLCALLTSAQLVCKDYASADKFLDVDVRGGGCLVADVRMPGMNGLELQEEVVRRKLPLTVIIVTGHGDVPLAVKAMKAGAIDFIEKPFDDELVIASVQNAIATGKRERNQSEETRLANELLTKLTARETQVLEQLVVGRSNKAAAYELSISPRTIEIHRAHIMDKLKARSLSDLVRTAIAASLPALVNH